MRILALDLETTGFSFEEDWITELGIALYEYPSKAPLQVWNFFMEPMTEVTEEITEITGITEPQLKEFGQNPKEVLNELNHLIGMHGVTHIVAHNGLGFDKPMLDGHYDRLDIRNVPDALPWIDTRLDLPIAKPFKSMHLNYLAAEHGFINPFPHRALPDAMTCAKILFSYDMDKVLALTNSPMLEIRAVVTFDDRDKAKALGYRWDPDRKYWCKHIKEIKLDEEKSKADFKVQRLN